MENKPPSSISTVIPTPSSSSKDYITTSTGSRIHRSCRLIRSDTFTIGGNSIIKEKCILYTDKAKISIGNRVSIGTNTIVQPPGSTAPFHIMDEVTIGNNNLLQGSYIGKHCTVGNNNIIQPRTIMYDYSTIHDDQDIGPGIVPPLTVAINNRSLYSTENNTNSSSTGVTTNNSITIPMVLTNNLMYQTDNIGIIAEIPWSDIQLHKLHQL